MGPAERAIKLYPIVSEKTKPRMSLTTEPGFSMNGLATTFERRFKHLQSNVKPVSQKPQLIWNRASGMREGFERSSVLYALPTHRHLHRSLRAKIFDRDKECGEIELKRGVSAGGRNLSLPQFRVGAILSQTSLGGLGGSTLHPRNLTRARNYELRWSDNKSNM